MGKKKYLGKVDPDSKYPLIPTENVEEGVERSSDMLRAIDGGQWYMERAAIQQGRRVFVGRLGKYTTEESVKSFFESYGEIRAVQIMRRRKIGTSRRFGYVEFYDKAVAHYVADQFDIQMDGHTLHTEMAVYAGQDHFVETLKSGNPVTLFVGKLPEGIVEDRLRGYFEKFGIVDHCEIARVDADESLEKQPKGVGKSRGFGFITFRTHEATERVLGQDVHFINGSRIAVRVKMPKNVLEENRLCKMSNRLPYCHIIVWNLTEEVDDEILADYFRGYGPLRGARVLTDTDGLSRQIGHVHFVCHQSADAAKADKHDDLSPGIVVQMGGGHLLQYVESSSRKDDEYVKKHFSPTETKKNEERLHKPLFEGRTPYSGPAEIVDAKEAFPHPPEMHFQNFGRQFVRPPQVRPQQVRPQQVDPQQAGPQQAGSQQAGPQQVYPHHDGPQQVRPQRYQKPSRKRKVPWVYNLNRPDISAKDSGGPSMKRARRMYSQEHRIDPLAQNTESSKRSNNDRSPPQKQKKRKIMKSANSDPGSYRQKRSLVTAKGPLIDNINQCSGAEKTSGGSAKKS